VTELDHLVVGARTLDEGVAWCEATLGLTPGPGGKHPLMGTHNRLFSIASARHPKAYFEIISIDPDAPPPRRARWFDLDTPAMREALAVGPQLIHWVLRCDDIEARCARLRAAGIERGEVLAASRGAFSWRISVRTDGARLAGGALPTLIQWDAAHPADDMPQSGVELLGLDVALAPAALRECAVPGMRVLPGEGLAAHLLTPRGELTLRSAH
jgi:hypothetical protein